MTRLPIDDDERELHADYRRKQIRLPPVKPVGQAITQLLARTGYAQIQTAATCAAAWREAVGLCSQIAEALEAARDHGIVHRDLKPANIKIARDGTAKVLDFGLAKFWEPALSVASGSSISPTSIGGTLPGAILGTPGYMSPEQTRGEVVDRSADVWALACVLYEASRLESSAIHTFLCASAHGNDIPASTFRSRSGSTMAHSRWKPPSSAIASPTF